MPTANIAKHLTWSDMASPTKDEEYVTRVYVRLWRDLSREHISRQNLDSRSA